MRWRVTLFKCCVNLIVYALTGIATVRRHIVIVLWMVVVCLLFWWAQDRGDYCDGTAVQEKLCQDFKDREIAGNMCPDFCQEDSPKFQGCNEIKDQMKIFQLDKLLLKTEEGGAGTPGNSQPIIEEGVLMEELWSAVHGVLVDTLGDHDHAILRKRLFTYFDLTASGTLTLGEAQSMWRLLHQQGFLQYFVFQGKSSFPHLNGTCGGVSAWQEVTSRPLFHRRSSWLVSLFSSHAYRWTLPSWLYRAKVAVSLLELIEDLYETEHVRYHLCNLYGHTIFRRTDYEVYISDSTKLRSARQIEKFLSNKTCHHDHDCVFTRQCQTTCNIQTRRCSPHLIRPTLVYACELLEDYTLFDAPEIVKHNLTRLLRRCRTLSQRQPKLDLTHSVLITYLKDVFWKQLQNVPLKV